MFGWMRAALAPLAALVTLARRLEQQATQEQSLRHLAHLLLLAQALPWPLVLLRRRVRLAVLARLLAMPEHPAQQLRPSPKSSSSRRRRAKSTTRQRR
jgi:hypothetical protein